MFVLLCSLTSARRENAGFSSMGKETTETESSSKSSSSSQQHESESDKKTKTTSIFSGSNLFGNNGFFDSSSSDDSNCDSKVAMEQKKCKKKMGKAKAAFKTLKAKAEKVTSVLDNKLKECEEGLKGFTAKVLKKEAMITKLVEQSKAGEQAMTGMKKDVSQCKADLKDEMKAMAMMKKKLSQCKADLKDEMNAMTQEKGELAKDNAKDKMCMADKKNLQGKLSKMMATFKKYKTEMSNAKSNLKHVVDQLQQCKTLYQPTKNRFVKGQFPRAQWGGYCTCPNGKKYAVSDGNSACAYLMCFGGKASACTSRPGPWSFAGVSCAPKKK